MSNKLADTFNEYGTPVTLFSCPGCNTTFMVCPAVPDDALDQWTGCLGEGCPTYDPARDADKLFDEGKVHRVGDRSHLKVLEPGGEKPSPAPNDTPSDSHAEASAALLGSSKISSTDSGRAE